jgi:protein-L-isoaspartate(D-aspartate) O-methyltransferase
MGQIAAHVYALERLAVLGLAARERMHELGYENVEVLIGDGTKGLPEEAPFDAILVAAGGSEIPQSLQAQVRIGGRLVMPVGRLGSQALLKLIRRSAHDFSEENLGAVAFVPLVADAASELARRDQQ